MIFDFSFEEVCQITSSLEFARGVLIKSGWCDEETITDIKNLKELYDKIHSEVNDKMEVKI